VGMGICRGRLGRRGSNVGICLFFLSILLDCLLRAPRALLGEYGYHGVWEGYAVYCYLAWRGCCFLVDAGLL